MNLKPAFVILALSLPLAGCGNKGPLILPQDPPPTEARMLPAMPPMDDVGVPVDGAPPAPPASDDATVPLPPPPAGGDGNG